MIFNKLLKVLAIGGMLMAGSFAEAQTSDAQQELDAMAEEFFQPFKKTLNLAQKGDVEAQYNLGNMYANGEGVPRNDVWAVKWFRKAADQGYEKAQYSLGVMYINGRGVPQNDAEAVKLYRKAAKQGFADAQFNLGVMHIIGRGVPQNFVKAYSWFLLAEAQGNEKAQSNNPIIAKELTLEQIAEAQKLSAKCFENNYLGCD